jgi:CRP-like cAMP-binding protein
MDKFQTYLKKHIDLDEDEWHFLSSKIKQKNFKKGEIISNIGDIHERIYFITSGLARAYLIDSEGKDFTWSIYFNDENSDMVNLFIVDYDSFITQKPSSLEIEALEDSTTVYLTFEDLDELHKQSPKVLLFSKMMADLAYAYLHHRVLDTQSKSAKERFEKFMKTTPHLLDKVPQYHIASLLGITPIHLSRLKNDNSN